MANTITRVSPGRYAMDLPYHFIFTKKAWKNIPSKTKKKLMTEKAFRKAMSQNNGLMIF